MELNALMVRYIVNDVDAAIAFYGKNLGFRVTAQSGPLLRDSVAGEHAACAQSAEKARRRISTDARWPKT